jgi:hypothetical protein
MQDETRRSRHQRARAIDRLRTLTVGTTLAGVAATAGFGGLAAITYSGYDDQADDSGVTTAAVDAPDDTPAPTAPTTTPGGRTGTTSPGTVAAPTPSPTPRKTHHAHVTSGGSGG